MTDQHIFYVYVIFRPSGEPCYVGKGKGGRWQQHIANARNPHLRNIYLKHDRDLPIVKVREGLTEREAFDVERALILAIGRKANGGPLVNMTDGGDGPAGYVHTEEVRVLVGDLSKKMWADDETRARVIAAQNVGKSGPEFAAKRSAASKQIWEDEDRRARMSDTQRVRFSDPDARRVTSETTKAAMATDDMRAKLSAAQKLRFADPEQRKKQSHIWLGKKFSKEHKAKIAAAHLGQKRSVEARAKMSAWQIGRVMSKEARAKMSVAAIKRHDRPEVYDGLFEAITLFIREPE